MSNILATILRHFFEENNSHIRNLFFAARKCLYHGEKWFTTISHTLLAFLLHFSNFTFSLCRRHHGWNSPMVHWTKCFKLHTYPFYFRDGIYERLTFFWQCLSILTSSIFSINSIDTRKSCFCFQASRSIYCHGDGELIQWRNKMFIFLQWHVRGMLIVQILKEEEVESYDFRVFFNGHHSECYTRAYKHLLSDINVEFMFSMVAIIKPCMWRKYYPHQVTLDLLFSFFLLARLLFLSLCW